MPLDRLLGLSRHKAAGKFEEQICHLAATQPFELVQTYLEEMDGVSITETMIRETAEDCGRQFIRDDEQNASSSQLVPSPTTDTLYIETDGSMVPLRAENGKTVEYRENKLGILFRSEDIETLSDGKRRIRKKRFVNSLGKGVQHFEKLLKRRAQECGSRRAGTVVFISDGAEWIDQMRQRLFPKSVHILDWYHAEEHLWSCAKSVFGESESLKHAAWVHPLKELLWDGLGEAACERLNFEAKRHPNKQTAIHELRSYLESRIEKMRYADFRRQGYFIGSGAVESANKYLIQTRLKQAGMKWTRDGAEAIIKLREILYDHSWQGKWSSRRAA
jgi:hypothetical protein